MENLELSDGKKYQVSCCLLCSCLILLRLLFAFIITKGWCSFNSNYKQIKLSSVEWKHGWVYKMNKQTTTVRWLSDEPSWRCFFVLCFVWTKVKRIILPYRNDADPSEFDWRTFLPSPFKATRGISLCLSEAIHRFPKTYERCNYFNGFLSDHNRPALNYYLWLRKCEICVEEIERDEGETNSAGIFSRIYPIKISWLWTFLKP